MHNDEFYVGWMEKGQQGYVKHLKNLLLVTVPIVIMIGLLLALCQRQFATGTFEFGKMTEVKGIYFNEPIPLLKAFNGKDIFGNLSFITIPLIGFGKSGAEGVIATFEKQKNISLNHKEVSMKGTLLYNDGKLLMQIDGNDVFLPEIGLDAGIALSPVVSELGEHVLHGEIVDPKCFFGVMKPGQGKPHKDCAIRCILGGIPPVLKVTNDKGNDNYYLLLGANGEKMNEAVKHLIGEPVTVRAKVIKHDDWIILYVKEKGIAPFSYLREHFGEAVAACGAVCTK